MVLYVTTEKKNEESKHCRLISHRHL